MITFFKANVASLVSSLCDYMVTIIAVHFFSVNVVVAGVTGTLSGGLTHFAIGRHWVFTANNVKASRQVKKYLLIWLGNLMLNATGMYLFTQLGVNYMLTKAAMSLFVGVAYNYPFQKSYVFKTT